MNVSSSYRTFLKVSIFHSYFLNDGEKPFATMNGQEAKKQLEYYRWQDFLEIVPTAASQTLMNGAKMVCKTYPDALVLAIKVAPEAQNKPFIDIDPTAFLSFTLTLKDRFFGNYTDLDFADRLLFLSNKQPTLPDPFSFTALQRINEAGAVNEASLYEGKNKDKLLKDNDLTTGQQPFGVLQIHFQGDTPTLGIINNDGTLKNTLPHFKIHFDNRKTTWKYIHYKDEFETETKKEWPLTKFGFIPLDKQSDFISPPAHFERYVFPNPDARQLKVISDKFYSEIFI